MARFNDAYLTDAGADLIAQSITDGVKIDFVRMEIGDGEYTEEEKSKDVLRKRTNLKNKRQESSFNSVEKAKDSAVKLKAAIDNRNVTNGYRMTEIGIFAKASGDTASDGVLYSIAVAVEADYMPPESTPITYIQEFYTKVGNAENVEITVSTGVYALAEDLAEVEEPTYTESEELEELTPGENLKLALGKLAKAVKEIITHMALKATGSVAGHVKVSSSAAVTDSTGMALAATEKNASLEGTLAYKLEQLNTNLTWKHLGDSAGTNVGGTANDITLPDEYNELLILVRPNSAYSQGDKRGVTVPFYLAKAYVDTLPNFELPYYCITGGHTYPPVTENKTCVAVKVSSTTISLDFTSYGDVDTTASYYMSAYYR